MIHATLRRNGAQDLSVNWLQRYRSEVLSVCTRDLTYAFHSSRTAQRQRSSAFVAAIDIGTGLVKVAGRAQAESVPRVKSAASWYSVHEEVFSSHGTRSTYTSQRQIVVERSLMTQNQPYVCVPPSLWRGVCSQRCLRTRSLCTDPIPECASWIPLGCPPSRVSTSFASATR